MIRQLVAGFQHAGVRPGDTVLVHSFNSIYYPILVLGIIGCGAIYTGSNPGYTAYEVWLHAEVFLLDLADVY